MHCLLQKTPGIFAVISGMDSAMDLLGNPALTQEVADRVRHFFTWLQMILANLLSGN
jgi:hypothetical protein